MLRSRLIKQLDDRLLLHAVPDAAALANMAPTQATQLRITHREL